MKVWPIDPLVPRNLRLEVPEKLLRGSFSNDSPAAPGGVFGRHCQTAGKALELKTTAPLPKGLSGTGA